MSLRIGIVVVLAIPSLVLAGEKKSDLWSLRPLTKSAVPKTKDASWPRTPIDQFLLAMMEQRGIKPEADTDRRILIRRLTFDLTGLPPTPDEVEEFVHNDSPTAFAKLIERLLASPAYGERWGRHWLDLVRYADTAGDNSDYPIPQIFRYRNWVIDAFNRDLPYDEFVRQQLAGDLLPFSNDDDRRQKLIATGYLANARRFGSYEEERYPWYLTIEDTIDNLGRTFLGVTINCCRCHDHKFDPFTQNDYYALYGFFSSTRYPRPGIELDKVQRDFVPLASDEIVQSALNERKRKLGEFDKRIKQLSEEKTKLEKDKQKPDAIVEQLKAVRKEKEEFEKRPLPFESAYAVAEGKTEGKRRVGNATLQIKGDPERLGTEVPRRFPTSLGAAALAKDEKGSGRLQLADWITDAKNPLFARVMVNRIWQNHFGRGLVPTPSDFGNMGQPPTHPELLDWLACQFIESGYSIKAMHRLIVGSRAYQLSSNVLPAEVERDVANECYSRFDRRRLDAESIRDSLLSVGGGLDRSPGGAHPFPDPKTWNFTQHAPFKAVYETKRRSVYLMSQRIQRHPFLALFDGADTNASTATRTSSTTSLQALFLMNDPFVHAQAAKFAKRIQTEATVESERVDRAYRLLFGRGPTADEQELAAKFRQRVIESLKGAADAEQRSWESLARAWFMSNEFLIVE